MTNALSIERSQIISPLSYFGEQGREREFPSQLCDSACFPPVPPERDSTVAVIVGASVGGFLAVVILVLMVVKCVRRKKEQKLSTDDLKTEEEGKTDGEGNPEDGAK